MEELTEIVESHDKKIASETLDRLIKKLEDIDECEFAMFSLCLIREKVEEIKND